MKEHAVRTTVDIPGSLYRKLKEQAAAQGRSVPELILSGVRITLVQAKRRRSTRVKFPLIASEGPKVDLTNQQIYEHAMEHACHPKAQERPERSVPKSAHSTPGSGRAF